MKKKKIATSIFGLLFLILTIGVGCQLAEKAETGQDKADHRAIASSDQKMVNIFGEDVSNWPEHKEKKLKAIDEHIYNYQVNYKWLDGNPIAFTGMPFVAFRAIQELYGKKDSDIFSAAQLKKAGVKTWTKADEELIQKHLYPKSARFFTSSRDFGFPVGLNETRIVPGLTSELKNITKVDHIQSARNPSEAAQEQQLASLDKKSIPVVWDEKFLDEIGLADVSYQDFEINGAGEVVGSQRVKMMVEGRFAPLRGVTFACGACHIGRARVGGAEMPLIGGPNVQFDPQAVINTFEKLGSEIGPKSIVKMKKILQEKYDAKDWGWFYGGAKIEDLDKYDREEMRLRFAQTAMELKFLLEPQSYEKEGKFKDVATAIGKKALENPLVWIPSLYPNPFASVENRTLKVAMETLKIKSWFEVLMYGTRAALSTERTDNYERLLQTTYHPEENGFVDADGIRKKNKNKKAALAFLQSRAPGRVDTLAAPFNELSKEQKGDWKKFVQRKISKNDYPSVWQQSRRKISNWDGAVGAFYRNIGSGLSLGMHPGRVDFRNGLIQKDFIENLDSPPYPYDDYNPSADEKSIAKYLRGKSLYENRCATCHDHVVDRNDLTLAKDVGTDLNRAVAITDDMAGFLADKIIEGCKDKNFVDQFTDPSYIDGRKVCDDRVERTKVVRPIGGKPEENGTYKKDTLDGIWARAPYLHNGSIPTIWQLLRPSERPQKFCRGSIDYDPERMGFQWLAENGSCPTGDDGKSDAQALYDTSLPSQSNAGHSGEIFLGKGITGDTPEDEAEDLIFYLKSL